MGFLSNRYSELQYPNGFLADGVPSLKKFFILLGMPRCATSWLHSEITKQSGIDRVARKEIHYFLRQYGEVNRLSDVARLKGLQSFAETAKFKGKMPRGFSEKRVPMGSLAEVDDLDPQKLWTKNGANRKSYLRLKRGLNWYLRYAKGPVNDDWFRDLFSHVDDDDWALDFSTTNGAVNDAGFKAMANFADETKALLILRHPLDRLWSHVRLNSDLSGESEKQKFEDWDRAKVKEFVEDRFVLERSMYSSVVAGTLKHFAPENRLILNYEDLAVDPAGTVSKVIEFLGLTPDEKIINRLAPREGAKKGVRKSYPKLVDFAQPCLDNLREVSAMGIDMVDPWIEDLEKMIKT